MNLLTLSKSRYESKGSPFLFYGKKGKDWKAIFVISKLWYYAVYFLISKILSGCETKNLEQTPHKRNVHSSSEQNTTESHTILGLQTKPLLIFLLI